MFIATTMKKLQLLLGILYYTCTIYVKTFFIIITHFNKTTIISYLHIDKNFITNLHTKNFKFTIL